MSFAEHGITGRSTTKDGKRFFDIRQVKAMEILNMPITILDFEPGVMTSHGGGRYSVKMLCGEKEVKMITNSITLKSQLDQAREMELFPIETRLKRRDAGGNVTDYVFE